MVSNGEIMKSGNDEKKVIVSEENRNLTRTIKLMFDKF